MSRQMRQRTGGSHATGVLALLLAGVLGACAVGPDYRRPAVTVPPSYKEQAPDGWKPGQPADLLERGRWWAIYDDPLLDGLLQQVDVSNQNLKAAEAAYRQSQAVVQAARASFFPTVGVNASATRSRSSGALTSGSSTSSGTSSGGKVGNLYNASLDANWQPDLWGSIRRTVEGDVATAQASAAQLAAARLSAQAQLATDYFELRVADELKRLLEEARQGYARSLAITRNQYAVGVVAQSDVITAETQLQSTLAQEINVGVQRAQLEHAIALLIGKAPAELSIAPGPLASTIPEIPVDVPSTLLERRPDIATAERQVASANAQIGVATAAFFPTLTLSANAGYEGSVLHSLFEAPNYVWSVGAQLAETLFDAGARSAKVRQARAAYDESVANYRQTVLTAFQQVEDALAELRILAQQVEVQRRAAELARKAQQLTLNQYKAGTVAYTSVVQAQVIALTDEQAVLTIQQQRLTASVALIAALGGGWDASQLAADGHPARAPAAAGDPPRPN